jgi:hypothetical protein
MWEFQGFSVFQGNLLPERYLQVRTAGYCWLCKIRMSSQEIIPLRLLF